MGRNLHFGMKCEIIEVYKGNDSHGPCERSSMYIPPDGLLFVIVTACTGILFLRL